MNSYLQGYKNVLIKMTQPSYHNYIQNTIPKARSFVKNLKPGGKFYPLSGKYFTLFQNIFPFSNKVHRW